MEVLLQITQEVLDRSQSNLNEKTRQVDTQVPASIEKKSLKSVHPLQSYVVTHTKDTFELKLFFEAG